VRSAEGAYRRDMDRLRQGDVRPIEVLDGLQRLSRSQGAYLDAIVDYNEAQFSLYVALAAPPLGSPAWPFPATLRWSVLTTRPRRRSWTLNSPRFASRSRRLALTRPVC